MSYVFSALAADYNRCLSICETLPSWKRKIDKRSSDILKLKSHYESVSSKTNVPILWLMVINERESSSNLNTYLGNGQSLRRRTTEVPRGRGPFATWEEGALDALHVDRIDSVTDWTWNKMCYEEELWNGFGPRMHGKHTGYLWAGTNIYDGGKYVSDGVWSSRVWDTQIGTVPLMRSLVALDPTLNIPGWPGDNVTVIPGTTSVSNTVVVAPPVQHPDITVHNILWVQESLNYLDDAYLVTDGSFGKNTRNAVAEFQEKHGLLVDGIPGTNTKTAIEEALKQAV